MQEPIPRRRVIRWRRVLFQIHLWIGLLAGFYVFVVCVTGAALVFRIELQRASHPQLFTPAADGPLTTPIAVLEAVRQAYPQGRVAGVDAPTTARPTYLAYVTTTGGRFATVLIDPVSARVLGELPERSLVRTIQELHFNLLAGRTGQVVNGVGAGCLLIMCATGAVIWWPRVRSWRRAFTIDRRGPWRRAIWDFHGITGVCTMAFLIVVSVTGLSFTFPSAFRAAIGWLSPISVQQAPQSRAPSDAIAHARWDDLIDRARQRIPGHYVARVVIPSTARAAFLVMFSPDSPTPVGRALTSVYLDPFTGEVLSETSSAPRTFGDAVLAWMGPLHFGNFGGPMVKVAWLMLGLGPPLLFMTGFILWWTRVVRPRVKAALCICLFAASVQDARAQPMAPARIVSTSPSITEILFALGLGGRVVGVSQFCRYPDEVAGLPAVGTFLKPDVERIARLHPDLTILQGSQHGIEARLQMLKLASITVERGTLASLFTNIRAIGAAAHASDGAESLIARLEQRLARVSAAVSGRSAVKVLVVVGRRAGTVSDLVAAAERTYLSDLVGIAGGANVLSGQTALEYPRVSMETIIRLAPDVIVDASVMADTDAARRRSESATEALWRSQPLLPRTTRVHVAISDAILLPGPRLVDVVETLARWFHGVHPTAERPKAESPKAESREP